MGDGVGCMPGAIETSDDQHPLSIFRPLPAFRYLSRAADSALLKEGVKLVNALRTTSPIGPSADHFLLYIRMVALYIAP